MCHIGLPLASSPVKHSRSGALLRRLGKPADLLVAPIQPAGCAAPAKPVPSALGSTDNAHRFFVSELPAAKPAAPMPLSTTHALPV